MSDRYQVKFELNGQTHYGFVDNYTKPKPKKGFLHVKDVLYPVMHTVPEKELVDVPFNYPNDEIHQYIQKEFEKAQKLAKKNPAKGVHVNDMFHLGVADGMAHYLVTAVNGSKCRVEWRGFGGADGYIDHHFGWGGFFPKKDVQRYIESEKGMAKLFSRDDHEDYYNSLEVGEIVHYHNGFNEFVRCVVKEGNYDAYFEKDKKPASGKYLQPIALVGNWREHDLPRRMADGSIYYPTHSQLKYGFEPNFSNIYESPRFVKDKAVDPRKLEPVDLSVPPMTDEEALQAGYHRAADMAKCMLNKDKDTPVIEDVKERMEAAIKVMQDAINGNPPPLKE